jgi:hypothetical protein
MPARSGYRHRLYITGAGWLNAGALRLFQPPAPHRGLAAKVLLKFVMPARLASKRSLESRHRVYVPIADAAARWNLPA